MKNHNKDAQLDPKRCMLNKINLCVNVRITENNKTHPPQRMGFVIYLKRNAYFLIISSDTSLLLPTLLFFLHLVKLRPQD